MEDYEMDRAKIELIIRENGYDRWGENTTLLRGNKVMRYPFCKEI